MISNLITQNSHLNKYKIINSVSAFQFFIDRFVQHSASELIPKIYRCILNLMMFEIIAISLTFKVRTNYLFKICECPKMVKFSYHKT